MKSVYVMAMAAGLVLFGAGDGFAQACKQTLDLTPQGGPKMVQCHELVDMPQSSIDQTCRPSGNPNSRTVSERLDKCPASYVGICATPMRTVQANIRRMQGLPPDENPTVSEKAMLKAYFYEGAPADVADLCGRGGGTWTAGKAAPAAKSTPKKQP